MNREYGEINKVIRLDWDSNLFNTIIGRIYAKDLTIELLRKRLKSAREENIEFVELFCDVSDDKSIDASEKLGFHLADVRITLKKNLDGDSTEDKAFMDLIFKKAEGDDIDRLKTMSKGLFKDSRYYRYQNFNRNNIDLMFQIWIEKSVRGEFDDELYCLYNKTDILAFCTLKYIGNSASIGLFGISSTYRGKGIGNLMLKRIFKLLYQYRVTEVAVITQGKNTDALYLYRKNRFCLAVVTLCYYRWLD
jgi:GNAT superfamily N-acetyltransferase